MDVPVPGRVCPVVYSNRDISVMKPQPGSITAFQQLKAIEPRRLYRRYLLKYPKFVFQFIKHSLGFKVRP